MTMYNLIHGTDKMMPLINKILFETEEEFKKIERYRDSFFDFEKDNIVVLCRTGGFNAEDYPNVDLMKNANFISHEDGFFPSKLDDTYRYYYFKIPEKANNFYIILKKEITGKKKNFQKNFIKNIKILLNFLTVNLCQKKNNY